MTSLLEDLTLMVISYEIKLTSGKHNKFHMNGGN